MSDLSIRVAGSTQTPEDGFDNKKGAIIRITPTVHLDAYDDGDVLFLTTEIPKAVNQRGGVSKLIGIGAVDQSDLGKDFDLIFMQVQKNLIGALSPGSSGGVSISDADVEAAKIIGNLQFDFGDGLSDLLTSRISYGPTQSGGTPTNSLPMLLQAEPDSTSIYVAGVSRQAGHDYVAADDLDLIFHIEYL